MIHVKTFIDAILDLYPGCPSDTAKSIAEHACLKYSGRVGCSAAAKNLMIQPFAWQLLHTSAMLKPTTMNSLWKVGNVLMRGMVKDQLN